MTSFVVINGHAPWCSYIRSLDYFDKPEEPCDCRGWDDDEDTYDDLADGDYDW